MTASLLDGKALASLKKNDIKITIETLIQNGHRPPGLAVILVGDDPASHIYVNNKQKACKNAGIVSFSHQLPDDTSEEELLKLIYSLNDDIHVDGILVQLPLPRHINSFTVIESIRPDKDIDGFHPFNIGRLVLRNPDLRPCTPYGVIQLLEAYEIPLRGKHAVVIGASNIVGRPMSLELLTAGSTVTVCHRFTQSLEAHVRAADIVIVAVGRMDVIDTDWLQAHQVLIDVGIHRLQDGSMRGDVDFAKACERVSWITPVPGGVGPMTIAALLQNTLTAAQNHYTRKERG